MGSSIAPQEILQAGDVGQGSAAYQNRPAGSRFDERHAPEDHRAHQLFAERGLGDEQGMQLRGADLERLRFRHRNRIDQGRPARELGQLAHDVAGPVLDHRELMAVAVPARDAQGAREHHVNSRTHSPRLEDPIAIGEAPQLAEAMHARDLVSRENRKHLRAPRFDGRGSEFVQGHPHR